MVSLVPVVRIGGHCSVGKDIMILWVLYPVYENVTVTLDKSTREVACHVSYLQQQSVTSGY